MALRKAAAGGGFPQCHGKEIFMESIEIARRMAELGDTEEACKAYSLAIHENNGADPAQDMESAVYILQEGGNYKVSYTCFVDLYNRGCFAQDCLAIMTEAFYTPNVKDLQTRYERNCKLLGRYPYLFRRDFPAFEELPIQFYPFDDKSYIPFYRGEKRFGEIVNFTRQVVSRNFFKDLEKPVLAENVFSQYELEYLNDNVRASEHIGRENHIYLHYPDWGTFCSYLQCLNLRPLLEDQKIVFLIGDELAQYPIDFKERFGIDYSQHPVKPLGVRDFKRLIWHTQLATHNGGDFFNEIFDGHPNLLTGPSIMFDSIEETVGKIREALDGCRSVREAVGRLPEWSRRIVEELYLMRDRTDKDILVAFFIDENRDAASLNTPSRIVPALFFQPHFSNIIYSMSKGAKGWVTLYSDQYEKIRTSPLFRNFKYIKTFTPMRRPTTSYGATVKFMYANTLEDKTEGKRVVISDAISQRLLNRSFMIDWQDRLYMDSVLVRFEDGKLNPKATFTALAAFLDLPYTESMTYCSLKGEIDPESLEGNDLGFSTAAIYRTYDNYANDEERYFLEYFLRDAYEFYGYDFKYYDGAPMNEERVRTLVGKFEKINHYFADSWRRNVGADLTVSKDGEDVPEEQRAAVVQSLVGEEIKKMNETRIRNACFLLENPYYINKSGQPLRMMPKLELDPALLEQPLYH